MANKMQKPRRLAARLGDGVVESRMPNPLTEFAESLPERERQAFGDAILRWVVADAERQELNREKGRDPVGFLLRRLDFTGAPFPIELDHHPFERERVTIHWWPNGKRARQEVASREVKSASLYSRTERVTYRMVDPKHMAYDVEIDEGRAFRDGDASAWWLMLQCEQLTGFRPAVRSERESLDAKTPGPVMGGAGLVVGQLRRELRAGVSLPVKRSP